MTISNPKTKKVLGLFSLAMINVAIICSLRGLPTMAEYGYSIIFFLVVTLIIFLIPVSLVSAELATGWPKQGGIYAWVREAFGERWGFVAICMQWLQNLVFYPTALASTAAVIAYLFNPALAENKVYTIAVIIIVYWIALFINLRGMKTSGFISTIGSVFGIIIPGIVLIALAVIWIASGQPSQVHFSVQSLVPDLSNIKNIVFLTGLFLFFAGMEVSGVHATEVENPQKNYPKAILISGLIIFTLFLLGSLAVSIILPQQDISLTAGLMQTFTIVFDKFNLGWAIPILVLLAAPGMMVQVSSWIAGPSRGLIATAKNGDLPPIFQKMNKNNMPINIMIFQGIVVSLISLIFLFMPSVSSSFWILTALAALVYLTVYIIMFAAAIKLRYSQPNTVRAYKIPGGKFGMWAIAGLGILACVFAIIIGFVPPAQLTTGNTGFYVTFLMVGLILFTGIPFAIYALRKPSWKKNIHMD